MLHWLESQLQAWGVKNQIAITFCIFCEVYLSFFHTFFTSR